MECLSPRQEPTLFSDSPKSEKRVKSRQSLPNTPTFIRQAGGSVRRREHWRGFKALRSKALASKPDAAGPHQNGHDDGDDDGDHVYDEVFRQAIVRSSSAGLENDSIADLTGTVKDHHITHSSHLPGIHSSSPHILPGCMVPCREPDPARKPNYPLAAPGTILPVLLLAGCSLAAYGRLVASICLLWPVVTVTFSQGD